MRTRWIYGLLLLATGWMVWWLGHNPLPDGFQNEFLHVGNAYDLWGAVLRRAGWQVRLLVEGNYWPPGFYLATMPALWVEALVWGTQSRAALVGTNLLHLAVLLFALRDLGRVCAAPLAPVLALLCPGVFGCLVRYEPNLAVVAWTAAGLAFLVRSDGLQRLGPVLGWCLCLGVGLYLDRLSAGFFLLPAALPLLPRAGRRGWVHLALGLALVALATLPWYVVFWKNQAAELLSQAPVGEIDSAGVQTETHGALALLYYPLALIDSQAGPLLGLATLAGLWGPRTRERAVLWASAGCAVLFFTCIAKKQVYYTLPILAPLSVLAAARRPLAWLGLVGGIWGFLALGLGVVPGGPWLPEAWVAPRHTLARPPVDGAWPVDQAVAALGPSPRRILVYSEDEALYEGFVVLTARERWLWADVRGVVLDPQGTSERLDQIDAFLWVTPDAGVWPDAAGVQAQLLADHYDLDAIPPVAAQLQDARSAFEEVGRFRTDALDLVAFRRK